MLIEEPVVELDERTMRSTHSALLPDGVLEHHIDPETQKESRCTI